MIALKNTTNNQIFYIIHRKLDGDKGWDLMPLNVEYKENGQYSVVPPSGFDGFSSVNVTVDVDQSACNLTTSTVTITGNGEHTITPPEGYDGFTEVIVNVENDCDDRYDDGVADQKAKLTSTTFTENGSYSREDGWNAVQVNVDTVTPYNNGKQDGVDEQKAKLTNLNVTQNGTYRREDGWNEVVVSVAQLDNCEDCRQAGIQEQKSKLTSLTVTENGNYTREDGWNSVSVNVDTVTPYNEGVVDQKNRLGEITITSNGVYTAEDGYKKVTVAVDCSCDGLVLSRENIDMAYTGDFPAGGVTYPIGVYSACSWSITNAPDWVTIDQMSGNAGVSIINVSVNSLQNGRVGTITISNCEETKTITITQMDYTEQYLTLEVTKAGTLYWKQYGIAYTRTIQFSGNGEHWFDRVSVQTNNGCKVADLRVGDKIMFRANAPTHPVNEDNYYYFVFANGLRGNVYGNLGSLNGGYRCLFKDCAVESAEHLIVPEGSSCTATFAGCTRLHTAPAVLPRGYYQGMFSNCTSLVNPPQLPSMTLGRNCYSGMFQYCSSLVNAPELPATELAVGCYSYMFRDCDSLTRAPELPALTLVEDCYDGMFFGSNNLNYIKAMFTSTTGDDTDSWVYNVAENGTFVKNANSSWDVRGSSGIPQNWTVQTA